MKIANTRMILPAVLALLAAACGGGGGGDDSSAQPVPPASTPPPAAGGTTSVIVTGAISGFGSVIVNGVRYDTSRAEVRIEDRSGTLADLSVGHVVRVSAEVDDKGGASARLIEQHRLLQGTVQAVDVAAGTLTVSGQVVRVDDDTSFDDSIARASLAGLAVGERVEVHGFSGSNGQGRATRIERPAAGDLEIEAKGLVAGIDTVARRFRVGTLVVDYSSATLEGFGSTGPRDGDFVEVKGRELLADGALKAVRVHKDDDGVNGQGGTGAEVEGLVTRFASATDFDVAGQKVTTGSATSFVGGSASDLKLDVKVEVEGKLDAGGTLVAAKVVFKRASPVHLAGRVESVDAASGVLKILGLDVVVDASTRKEDKEGDDQFFAIGSLRTGDWVEVRGYPDPSGSARIVATRLEREKAEDESEIRGRADSLQAPRLRIAGVSVETTPATRFEDEDRDITAATFFTQANGLVVDARGAWDGRSLTATRVEIDRDDGSPATPPVTNPPPVTPPPVTPPPVTPPPVTPPAPTLDGAALYASNCAGCHGSIGSIRLMPVSNRNVADFQRAISSNKGGMGFLGTLTAAQLQAIADAIKAANP
jgi:hypothetical protein